MQDMLQQLFNFYFGGGWLWLALVPLLLLIAILIDNQRHQRQALTWILLLAGCLCVFAPSLFYSLSDGRALTQSTREIFYAGISGVMGAVLSLIGYVVSFQWHLQPQNTLAYAYPHEAIRPAGEGRNDSPTEITGHPFPLNDANRTLQPLQPSVSMPLTPPPAFYSSASVAAEKAEYAPGWLQDRAGHQYRLLKNITHVGREDDQDIRFTELTVSRRHALIRHEQYSRVDVFVLDAIGKSETALNGVILGKDAKQLYDGDRIRLGTVELTFFTQAGR